MELFCDEKGFSDSSRRRSGQRLIMLVLFPIVCLVNVMLCVSRMCFSVALDFMCIVILLLRVVDKPTKIIG